jgi:hypothetical protein
LDYGIRQSSQGIGTADMTQPETAPKSAIPVTLWIVVALAALATAVVIAALAFAEDEVTKPLLVTFFGVISTSIPAIIALSRADTNYKLLASQYNEAMKTKGGSNGGPTV